MGFRGNGVGEVGVGEEMQAALLGFGGLLKVAAELVCGWP